MPQARRIFLLFSVSLLLGTIWGGLCFGAISHSSLLLFSAGLILLLVLCKRSIYGLIVLAVLLGIGVGEGSYGIHEAELNTLSQVTENFVKKGYIEGTVMKLMSTKERSRVYLLRIDTFDNFDTTSTYKIPQFPLYRKKISPSTFVEVPSNLDIHVGERIGFEGKIRKNIDFPLSGYDRYAFLGGGYGYIFLSSWERLAQSRDTGLWRDARGSLSEIYSTYFPRDVAGILLGMTIGSTDLLQTETKKEFIQSGISHILVVSGSNIAFVILFLVFFLKYIPGGKTSRTLVVTLFLILYGTLVSWEVSVIRATIMGVITYTVACHGGNSSSRATLALALCLMCLYDPLGVVYDAGFALSFGATAGIIIFRERIEGILSHMRVPKILFPYFSITIGASLGSIPALLYHFGSVSPFSLIANILIAGVLGWILMGSIIVLSLTKISSILAYAFGYAVYIPTKFVLGVGSFFAVFPIISFSKEASLGLSLFLYGILIVLFVSDD